MRDRKFSQENIHNETSLKDTYKVIIVDDKACEDDNCEAVIEEMNFATFSLEPITVYSADEAKHSVHTHKNVALVMIKMTACNNHQSGLDLIHHIRNEMKNKRISFIQIVRDKSEFPSISLIEEYNISDCKTKEELTSEALFMTVRNCVKQYEQLARLEDVYKNTYKQMTTNSLTHLPNRIKLNQDFAEDRRSKTLVLIDIIGFSVINETSGYAVGDFVLAELGGFLAYMYSDDFRIYHLDNDLFALVSTDDHLDTLVETVETIKDDISKLHLVTDNFNKTIDTTIGVAYKTENDIMRKAELALKEARNAGKNQIKYFSNDLKIIKTINETNHWSPIVKEGLKNGNILAYYQPIFNLQTNEIEKYELLVRLKHKGIVYAPIYFLEAAEYSGQLYDIFKFMFIKGCEKAAQTGMKFSINISDAEFLKEDLLDFIKSTLQAFRVDASLLSLELLENHAISHEKKIKEMINKIHELGIGIVIDDFGVHCSNFGQIEGLPVDVIKVDGSFIKNLATCVNSQIVVKTIKTFTREKNMKLIAEFVSSQEVYDIVKELGVDYAQGYYLGEPALELVQ